MFTTEGIATCEALSFMGTMDLPAKAMAMEMTQFNAKYGCGPCEVPGKVVKG